MSDGFEEADIRAGLREGGSILSAFIVGRPAGTWNATEYVSYLRTSWRRGYHVLQVRRKLRDKIYMGNGLGRLAWLLRMEFGFRAPLMLYEAGSQDLQRFTDLRPVDRYRPHQVDGPSPGSAEQEPALLDDSEED